MSRNVLGDWVMTTKRIVAAAAVLASVAGGHALAADMTMPKKAVVAPAPFFAVSDTSVSYHYEFTATDPGVNKTAKNVFTLTHFDIWQYGTNFFNIDFLKSDSQDPSNGCAAPGPDFPGCDGAVEVYGFYRGTLGFNELSHSKTFSYGWLQDVSFEFGVDANTENTTFAPQKRDVVAGLQFAFGLPGGISLNVAPLFYKEWNHNGFGPTGIAGVTTDFDPTWAVEVGYSIPIASYLGGVPLTISGYANTYGPKGPGFTGLAPTKTELHEETRLTLDLGQVLAQKPHWIDLWGGYRYWYNKFGNDHTLVPYSVESTWLIGLTWHAF